MMLTILKNRTCPEWGGVPVQGVDGVQIQGVQRRPAGGDQHDQFG